VTKLLYCVTDIGSNTVKMNNVSGFPSLSVSIVSPRETSPESFFLDLKCIRISFCRPLLAYVANFVPFGSGNFPEPLEPEQERECFIRMKNGDGEARKTLIEHNLRLVAHIIKKYGTSGTGTFKVNKEHRPVMRCLIWLFLLLYADFSSIFPLNEKYNKEFFLRRHRTKI